METFQKMAMAVYQDECGSRMFFSAHNKRGLSVTALPQAGILVQAICHFPPDGNSEIIADPRIKFPNFNSTAVTLPFSIMAMDDAVQILYGMLCHVFDQPRYEDMPPVRGPYLDYSTLEQPTL
ncbi:MAG TPA: hypothetical protein PKW15_02565 [Alphaproteobacteria bacterium]|nr:hypothetical protein [Alphaproteobacteria bacterium]